MIFEIDESVVKSAGKCKKGISCLSVERKDLCMVKHSVLNEVFFIECLNQGYCSYQQSFGNSFICTCPVRKEIYTRYKV